MHYVKIVVKESGAQASGCYLKCEKCTRIANSIDLQEGVPSVVVRVVLVVVFCLESLICVAQERIH